MPIYKQITEITNIDDLLSSVERDIEEVYFGDKQVFTVWAEYDGTLPATYSANGSTLADYRIYGTAGGVGDDSGTEYGYEVDMSVRSANKFDPTAYTATGFYLTNLGGYYSGAAWRVSDYIPVVAEGAYLLTSVVGQYPSYCWYNANKEFISGARYMATSGFTDRLLMAPQNAAFLRFSYVFDPTSASYNEDKCMVIAGSTAPPYQPYYNTTTPIYIGSSPLEEDEYVSFKEQKIYRMSGGVLTPTDPPVPLPAIPTINGTTITDYAGQSAAVPERFYAKYRKEDY